MACRPAHLGRGHQRPPHPAPRPVVARTSLPHLERPQHVRPHQAGPPNSGERIRKQTPARRSGHPDDLVGAAVFLASAASDFVTGVALPVDGGYSVADVLCAG
jgi:2-deoxy-D-gluconate 3-dehydrogenase